LKHGDSPLAILQKIQSDIVINNYYIKLAEYYFTAVAFCPFLNGVFIVVCKASKADRIKNK
jgi:hypothetical protein